MGQCLHDISVFSKWHNVCIIICVLWLDYDLLVSILLIQSTVYFILNKCWKKKIIATERPAHTSLLQPIWSHPAQGNGQKQAKKGSFWPKVPLLVALEVLGGPRGPDLVSTATGCSVCVGIMVTTHFWLILGLFWAAKDPKRDRFGPKCRFLAPWRSGTAWMECQQAQ